MNGEPRRRVPILLYHSVCDEPAPLLREWAISPARFGEQLDCLLEAGYSTLTVTDYVDRVRAGARLPDQFVVITFDDGFADFETGAAPALGGRGMAATLYVSTAYVGAKSTWLGPNEEQPMLTWDSIRAIAASGVEIGAHAHHHWALDELELGIATDEIHRSQQLLDKALGRPVVSFAYPHGYHSRPLQEVLRTAGFRSACGVKHASSALDDDLYGLARIIVPPAASGDELLALMSGRPVAARHEQLRTKAWRGVRRTRSRWRTRPDAVPVSGP